MIKPNIPNIPNIPGMGAMTDTLDFVKNLWGSMGLPGMNVPGMPGMNVPGMVMPTLSVDEINKRISDLKAVESWLSLNMGMLRSTIQALEVQAATISTLQTMGERFSATMNPAGAQGAAQSAGAGPNGAKSSNGADGGISAERDHGPAPEPTKRDEQDAASLTAPLVNAAAWWNMLQDQFKQAVNTAMTETQAVAAAATGATAAPPAEKPKAKAASPKAKAASSSASSSSATARKRKASK
ncbi:MAG TPA: PhaM family polyhydroxyalkanoate granule multifunctional regulatory protein [Noviherbaspirillum sp.]|nr:PhaM family polyhydroxyalkanoate granule multifunctional regulatory protein [Noviherbaspirillum sp.]